MVVADVGGDLGEVPDAVLRDELPGHRAVPDVDRGQAPVGDPEPLLREHPAQVLVERGHAVVVEGRRRGPEHRHVRRIRPERLTVPDQLTAHVPECVEGAAALELVDRHRVGEVEHVDLLQLRGRPELRGHDVERGVDVRHDAGVALADAGRLDDDEVEAAGPQHREDVGKPARELVGAAGGERPEEDTVAVEGVHADPVAEQRAATPAPGRVDRDDRHPQLVLLVDPEAAYQLVGEGGLARPAGAGDAEHRHGACGRGLPELVQHTLGEPALLGCGDRPRDRGPVAGEHRLGLRRPELHEVHVAALDHRADHPDQPHPLAVLRGEDDHAAAAEPLGLVGDDDPAAAPDDLDVAHPAGAQQLDEVLEVLQVSALVRRDRDALDVLLDGGVDDLLHRPVMPEVHDLGALALQDPADDVDRCVVAVEEARSGDDADRMGQRGVGQRHGRPLGNGSHSILGRPSNWGHGSGSSETPVSAVR